MVSDANIEATGLTRVMMQLGIWYTIFRYDFLIKCTKTGSIRSLFCFTPLHLDRHFFEKICCS